MLECARDVWLGGEGWNWTELADMASTRLLACSLAARSYVVVVQNSSTAAPTRQRIREQVSGRQPPVLAVEKFRYASETVGKLSAQLSEPNPEALPDQSSLRAATTRWAT